MTLTEARRKFEIYKLSELKREELVDMIDAAITVLHPSVKERLDEIIGMIDDDPFNGRKYRKYAVWRQCVIYKLSVEGYTNIEIARATGLNHATISCSIRNIKEGIRYMDKLTIKVWCELLEKMGEPHKSDATVAQ